MDKLTKLCITRTLSWVGIAYAGAVLMPLAIWAAMWLTSRCGS